MYVRHMQNIGKMKYKSLGFYIPLALNVIFLTIKRLKLHIINGAV